MRRDGCRAAVPRAVTESRATRAHGRQRRAATVLCVAGALLCGCSRPAPESTAARSIPVEVLIVSADTLRDVTTTDGVLEAYRTVEVVGEVSGTVEVLHRDVGERVASGTILASLDELVSRQTLRQAAAGLRAAEARYAVAREDHSRDSTLWAARDIAAAAYEASGMAWQTASADLQSARAVLALAQRQLDKCDVRAPFAGYVSRRHCEIGTFVTPGMPLFRIVDIDSLRLWLGVAQRHIARLRPGLTVHVTSEALPECTFSGRVRSISPEAEETSRTFPVEVILANPPGRPLRDGLIVAASIVIESLVDVVALPREAVLQGADGQFVFVVVDTLAHSRLVSVGRMLADRYLITAGLAVGEAVVVTGMQNLRDGSRVAINHARGTSGAVTGDPRAAGRSGSDAPDGQEVH